MNASVNRFRLVFDCADPLIVSHFWASLIGYDVVEIEPEYVRLRGEGVGTDELLFVEVEGWKAAPNRIRPDLFVDDLDKELARVLALGGTVAESITGPGGRSVILRDPEGNEFTLLERALSDAA